MGRQLIGRGLRFDFHALQRMRERGITQSQVFRAIMAGKAVADSLNRQGEWRYKFILNSLCVVVAIGSSPIVVTAWR